VRRAETNDESTTEIAQFLDVENGQVISLVEFLDTALAMQVLDGK
jgi:ketosteroid isomerase-like protein